MRPGEHREAHGVGVLLERGLGDHLGRLEQAGVDDLEAGVAQRAGDDLGPTVVPVEAGLGDHDPVLPLQTSSPRQSRSWPRLRADGPRYARITPWPSPASDRRLIVVTGGALLLAAAFFGGVLVLATRSDPGPRKPVFLGLRIKRKDIRAGGPVRVEPLRWERHWLDLEDGKVVALDVALGPGYCEVKWKRTTYIDCRGDGVTTLDLNRFKVIIGSLRARRLARSFVDAHAKAPRRHLARRERRRPPHGLRSANGQPAFFTGAHASSSRFSPASGSSRRLGLVAAALEQQDHALAELVVDDVVADLEPGLLGPRRRQPAGLATRRIAAATTRRGVGAPTPLRHAAVLRRGRARALRGSRRGTGSAGSSRSPNSMRLHAWHR